MEVRGLYSHKLYTIGLFSISLVSLPPRSVAGSGLRPGQEAVLIRHTTVEKV